MSLIARARVAAATERPVRAPWLAAGAAVLVVVAFASAAAPASASARWFLAICIASALVLLCARSTEQGVLATLVWLFALGTTRRLASEVLADPGRDPFVLVGAAAATVLAARAVLVGALQRLRALAWAVLAFSALAIVQIANPDQGLGLKPFAGLLVWVVPLLWFWVGRTLVDDRLARRVLVLVAAATSVTALYGVVQSVVGFPPWDERWIDRRGYTALFIGPETVRPFGSYASAAEFALACAVGAVIAAVAMFGPRRLFRGAEAAEQAAMGRRDRNRIVVVAATVFLVDALGLVLSANRTYVALLVVALPVVYLVVRGRRAWKTLAIVLAVAAVTFAALSQIDPDSIGRDGPEASIRRILVVVNDPFVSNEENTDNTLELHYNNAKRGVSDAFSRPLGLGTGATGIVGDQFGGGSTTTDADVTDAAIAFGIVGLALTLAIVVLGLVTAVRAALTTRTFESAAVVGVLIVSLGAWIQGAHYALAPVLWLLLGRADRAVVGPIGGVAPTGRAREPSGRPA